MLFKSRLLEIGDKTGNQSQKYYIKIISKLYQNFLLVVKKIDFCFVYYILLQKPTIIYNNVDHY